MRFLQTIWFDRVACGLFAVLAFASGFLPELFVVRHPDGSVAAAFVGVIVDHPTGESWDSTVYSPWLLILIFAAASYYYLVRATRPNPYALQRRHLVTVAIGASHGRRR
jgi:hypothetical protein